MCRLTRCMVIVVLVILSACKEKIVDVQHESKDYVILYDDLDMFIHRMAWDGSNDSTLKVQGTMPRYLADGNRFIVYSFFGFPPQWWYAVYDQSKQILTKLAFVEGSGQFSFISYSISPDSRKVAFSKPISGIVESHLYVADIDHASVTQMTTWGGNLSPVWSPDGRQISYSKTDWRDTTTSGYIVNSDGSNEHRVPYLAAGLVSSPVHWSPDGFQIAFWGKPDSSKMRTSWVDIYVGYADGKNVKRVTFDGSSAHCGWSPTGESILFTSQRDGGRNLYIMRPDGSAQVAITKHGCVFPAQIDWSADGRKIAYVYQRSTDGRLFIRTVNSDGTNDLDTGAQFRSGFSWKPF